LRAKRTCVRDRSPWTSTRDDPNELKKYADTFRADPERWLFLTGDEKTIHKMMVEQFKQARREEAGPDVKPGDEYGHSTRLLVWTRPA